MKIKLFAFSGILLMGMAYVACKKESQKNTEPSSAVKNYFAMINVTEENLSKANTAPTSNQKAAVINQEYLKSALGDTATNSFPCGIGKNYIDKEGNQVFEFFLDENCNNPEAGPYKGYAKLIVGAKVSNVLLDYVTRDQSSENCKVSYCDFVMIYDQEPNTSNDRKYVKEMTSKYGHCSKELNCYYKINGKENGQHKQIDMDGSSTYSSLKGSFVSTIKSPIYLTFVEETTSSSITIFDYKTKGVERIEYELNGQKGEFTVDYGNGEVDYKAMVTENGNSYEIDYNSLEKMYASLAE